MWLSKNIDVDIHIEFDDIKDEFEDEILDMIRDELFYSKKEDIIKNALCDGGAIIVARCINIIAENSECDFNELFHALSDEAKDKLKELMDYYSKYEKIGGENA